MILTVYSSAGSVLGGQIMMSESSLFKLIHNHRKFRTDQISSPIDSCYGVGKTDPIPSVPLPST
jgi:hypothetical protein